MTKAVYAGTFDPFTFGHLDITQRALQLFSELHLIVAVPHKKKTMISSELRVKMLEKMFHGNKQVKVASWNGLVVDYANKNKINVLVRGLRPTGDFESEFQMASMNKKLDNNMETVFFMTSEDHYMVSSSLVKEILAYGGSVERFVPEVILKEMLKLDLNE